MSKHDYIDGPLHELEDMNHELMTENLKLRADLDMAKTALEVYARTNETFPEYGTVARETLAKLKGGEGE